MSTDDVTTETRPSIREAQKLLTRQRLGEAAVTVFEEKGFAAATVDDIAAAAGASRGTFYLHFDDKIALAAGLVGEMLAGVPPYLTELDAALADGSREGLRTWARRMQGWTEDNRAVILLHEDLLGRHSADDLRDELRVDYLAHLPRYRAGAARGKENELTAKVRVMLLIDAIFQWSRTGLEAEGLDRDDFLDVVIDTFAPGFGLT